MINHSYSPDGFNIATIQPLIKNKRKSMNDSNNYRAIALSSPLAKIFDWVVLNKYNDKFITNDLQFGFKPKSSTTSCTFALLETVNYFQENNTDVYVLLLDATKAFDRVNYIKLFRLLLNRGLNPLVVKCLLYMYTNQHLNIAWNNCMSRYFATSNGVKQGGVLSPILFSVYIDELLTELKKSGYGCMIGHVYCGAFGYADDVSLVAPSLHALSKMCDICLQYAHDYDLQFNPAKCQLVKYGKKDNIPFYFNGTLVDYSQKAVHLGNIIGPDAHIDMVRNMCQDLIWRTNSVIDNFSFCEPSTLCQLFKSYCTSFYGISLWNLEDKSVCKFYTTWRKCVRKLLGVPNMTHGYLLPLIMECLPIETQVLTRFVKFFYTCYSSYNPCLRLLSNIALNGSRSFMSRTCNHIMAEFNINPDIFSNVGAKFLCSLFETTYVHKLDDQSVLKASFICDILCGKKSCDRLILSRDELDLILHAIYTE